MKKTLLALAFTALAATSFAQTIVYWDWNPSGTGTAPDLTPTLGSGTLSAVNLSSALAGASDTANGGSADPNRVGANGGLSTLGYATQGTGDGTSGIQILASTVGLESITLSYSLRHSNTSSRYEGVYYTLDGGTSWTLYTTFDGNAGDTWFNRSVDFSSITGANNNANFGVRITSIFEATALGTGSNTYLASNSTSTYATSGTWRFDAVTLSAVPEPGTVALLTLGFGVLLWRVRRVRAA